MPQQWRLEEREGLEELGARLKALSSVNRLRLVSELREPRTVDEIRLTPVDERGGQNPDRPLTRQGVRHHLSRLKEVDLVRSSPRPNETGRDRLEYIVNEPAVFGVLEELRDILAPGTDVPLDPFKTYTTERSRPVSWAKGPKLVLLGGAGEEGVFSLQQIDPDPDPARGWVIGRSPEAQICLQYDPYLSAQNTEIVRDEDAFYVVDLRTSSNGTVLNDEQLDPGHEVPLEHGDIVRAGCSALVFHRS